MLESNCSLSVRVGIHTVFYDCCVFKFNCVYTDGGKQQIVGMKMCQILVILMIVIMT